MAKGLESKEKKRKRTSRVFDRAYLHQGKLLYTVCVALTKVDGYFGQVQHFQAFGRQRERDISDLPALSASKNRGTCS